MDRIQELYYYRHRGIKNYASKKGYNKALVSNIRGIKLDQYSTKFYYHAHFYQEKGLLEIAQAKTMKGIQSLRKALKLTKGGQGPLFKMIGTAFMQAEMYEEAAIEFENAHNASYQGKNLYYYWGFCLEKLKRKQEAILKYQHSENLTPFLISYKRNKTGILNNIADGKYKLAIDECDLVLSLNQRFIFAYFNKAIALFCQDKIHEGVEVFSCAYAKLPQVYPKVTKVVKRYQKYLRKSKKELNKTQDIQMIGLVTTKIKGIERLLRLFDERTLKKSRRYTVFLPNILIAIIAFFIIGIVLLLLFQSNSN